MNINTFEIFNVVVDAVVRYWASLAEERAGGQDISRREVQYHVAFFYMDDGLVAPTDPEWLQGAFETLTRMFYRVELKTNVRKTVGMICRPYQAVGTKLETAHKQRMTV